MDLSDLASAIDELDARDAAASACGDDLVELSARDRVPDGPGSSFPPWSCGRDGAG